MSFFAANPACSIKLSKVMTQSSFLIDLDFSEKPPKANQAVHVLNVEIKDNPEEAIVGAGQIFEIAELVRLDLIDLFFF